jgi:hypothetical protein
VDVVVNRCVDLHRNFTWLADEWTRAEQRGHRDTYQNGRYTLAMAWVPAELVARVSDDTPIEPSTQGWAPRGS